jgi:hypothetical protein
MPLPKKEYFALKEIERRWGTERTDTIYYAENGLLAVAVPATELRIEVGKVVAVACGEALRVPAERLRACGPLRLRARDVATVLRRGSAEITEFRAEEPDYCTLAPAEKPLVVAAQDLVVARDERDRFEHVHRLGPQQTTPATRRPLADYRFVSAGGRTFQLGTMQAEAVRILHDAAVAGTPWVHGKDVLRKVGANSMRMVDLFKTQRHWRDLIASDGRGHYRLMASDLDSL